MTLRKHTNGYLYFIPLINQSINPYTCFIIGFVIISCESIQTMFWEHLRHFTVVLFNISLTLISIYIWKTCWWTESMDWNVSNSTAKRYKTYQYSTSNVSLGSSCFANISHIFSGKFRRAVLAAQTAYQLKTRLPPKRQWFSGLHKTMFVFSVRWWPPWHRTPPCASMHGSKTSLWGWTSVFLQGLSEELIQPRDHRTRVIVQASRDHSIVIYLVCKNGI